MLFPVTDVQKYLAMTRLRLGEYKYIGAGFKWE